MPNRYQSAAYQDMFSEIAKWEGPYCLACAVEGAGRRGPPSVHLEIDHAAAERHLLCKAHNLKMRRLSLKAHASLLAGYSAENVCVRIKKGELTNRVTNSVDYANGSIEMQASFRILNRWLEFMNEYLQANQSITKDSAIYAGAMASGGNPSTIYRHVKTYSAFNGPYMEVRQNGEKLIMFRPDYSTSKANMIHGNGHNGHKKLTDTSLLKTVEVVSKQ
jgi:hypothetical protein